MKHSLNISELIFLGVLILAVAYVLMVHLPIKEQMEALEAKQVELETEITTLQKKLQEQNAMQAAVDKVFANKDTTPIEIPRYDNISPMTMELHSIFADSKRYSISFGTEQKSDKIIRRTISISFSETSYERMRQKLTQICDSPNMYLITSISTSIGEGHTDYSTSMTLISFEYDAGTTTK